MTQVPPSASDDADDSGLDVVLAHYVALKEAGANINGYRQQAVALVVTAFVPVLGSLIALAAKDTTVGFARVALLYSLLIFAAATSGVAFWSYQMERRQRRYRESMLRLLNDVAVLLPVASVANKAWTRYSSSQDPFGEAEVALLPLALSIGAVASFASFAALMTNHLPGWPQ